MADEAVGSLSTPGGSLVERITDGQQLLIMLIRAGTAPRQTTFITPESHCQQVGFIVYPAGGEVRRHMHRAVERHVSGTPEVLVVRSGRCELTVYGNTHERVAVRELFTGDVVVIVGGGHSLRMFEDTVLLEVKQGPYIGEAEKQMF